MMELMKKLFFILLLCSGVTAQAQQGTGKKVLFIGDSITDGGWGNDSSGLPSDQRNHTDWNHLLGSGYMYLCAAHYMGEEPEKEYQFYNRGIGGHTLQNVIDRWQQDCLDLQPDVISLMVGTNDIHYWLDNPDQPFDFADWDARYRALLDRTIKALPGTKIIVCTPFVGKAGWAGEAENFPLRQESVRHLAALVKQIAADYNLTLMPFDELFEDLLRQYPSQPVSHWCWDGIHPTPATHQRMADLWILRSGL